MARGTLSDVERHCLDKAPCEQEANAKSCGLRVRFLDEEGKLERLVSADEVDCAVTRVKKIHILKNKSSSETSFFLRNPSLAKRRFSADAHLQEAQRRLYNNNSSIENLNGKIDKTEGLEEQTKDADSYGVFKKNCNVYSVNQKTIISERKKSIPLAGIPKLIGHRTHEGSGRSFLPVEGEGPGGAGELSSRDLTVRAIGRLSRGLGRLLRRTNSVRISEPDPVYKVAYLGNVLTGWARGESCIEKPLSTLWRNYQQSTKPDVVMKLSVTNSGLKGFTKEHGLTEYWSHRITYCASPPHYPKLFCWVYRHEGKKLKHELRCHAVLCTKESVSKKITEELQLKLKQALVEFKKDRISKQNARLSLANSVYENPTMPRRKILLSVGATNYRPPLERSKSAPKLGAIEELCSEEDEEEAEMKANENFCSAWARNSLTTKSSIEDIYPLDTLDRRRPESVSPRKNSCPDSLIRSDAESDTSFSDELLEILVKESKKMDLNITNASHGEEKLESRFHTLESIEESNESESNGVKVLSNNFHADSDDGSVSSGCETASNATSDAEPTSLPSQFSEEGKEKITVYDRIQSFEKDIREASPNEVNHVPIGEKNAFRRRCTYPPLKGDNSLITTFENKFESLIDNLTDPESLNSSTETEVYKHGDNDSACSDESGYSEYLDNKDSIIGSTIMV